MSETTSQKPLHRIFIIVSIVAFVGSTALGFVGMFNTPQNEPKQNAKTAQAEAQDKQLQAQARGYELVLHREPENQVALQGLVQARLAMNDLKGAVEPLEKLVKLNPDRESYKALLTEVKQRAGNTGKTNKAGDR
ncbi:tetratricopeptide repeat protein [Microcoleus sp. FACHB-831]|uniref:tetratricopeptide repeat protein n=1 Tax=Microcoleus sp. FACHB-831 TaxID=2692827 RepID=UPI001684D2ED|nr:tetratricopeptide repeat protein [Microcoleus sp. FACHB-831]MBD1921224.1 tetratricopeptide repeat protein [Microcoleus sp. FACHB-831]